MVAKITDEMRPLIQPTPRPGFPRANATEEELPPGAVLEADPTDFLPMGGFLGAFGIKPLAKESVKKAAKMLGREAAGRSRFVGRAKSSARAQIITDNYRDALKRANPELLRAGDVQAAERAEVEKFLLKYRKAKKMLPDIARERVEIEKLSVPLRKKAGLILTNEEQARERVAVEKFLVQMREEAGLTKTIEQIAEERIAIQLAKDKIIAAQKNAILRAMDSLGLKGGLAIGVTALGLMGAQAVSIQQGTELGDSVTIASGRLIDAIKFGGQDTQEALDIIAEGNTLLEQVDTLQKTGGINPVWNIMKGGIEMKQAGNVFAQKVTEQLVRAAKPVERGGGAGGEELTEEEKDITRRLEVLEERNARLGEIEGQYKNAIVAEREDPVLRKLTAESRSLEAKIRAAPKAQQLIEKRKQEAARSGFVQSQKLAEATPLEKIRPTETPMPGSLRVEDLPEEMKKKLKRK